MSSSVTPITSIQTASVTDTPDAQAKAPSASTTPALATVPAPPKADTVQLSTTAQVLSMKAGGSSVNMIASTLGIPASEVNSDLGITTSSSNTVATLLAALTAKH